MTSSSCVNPSLTYMALTARACDYAAKQLASGQVSPMREQAIQNNKASNTGLNRSNVGSWHSDIDMMQWSGEGAKKLANTAISIAKRMSHFEDSHP